MFIVYKTTNNINGKYYIGIHNTEGTDKWYLGSGTLIRAAIKKYGRDSFTRETLFENLDEESAKKIEADLVNEARLEDPDCYNLVLGGGYPPSAKGKKQSDDHRSKIGRRQKESWATGNRVQHLQSEEFKQRMRLNNPSRDTRVNRLQSQGRKAYFAKMTPEERSAYAHRCATTRKMNKLAKAQQNV